MKKITLLYGLVAVLAAGFMTSCVNDLDTTPRSSDELTTDMVYRNPDNYINVVAKIYGSLAMTGQKGNAGQPDIQGIDEGNSGFVRLLFVLQELPTDEAVYTWYDGSIKDLHKMSWQSTSEYVTAFYYRLYYTISIANEFLRETTQAKLTERQIPANRWDEIAAFQNEVRFIRAMCYWQLCDAFGTAPYVDEAMPVGSKVFPKPYTRKQLFEYVEKEMIDAENKLPDPRTNEYGRVDKASAWMLLAKLYLNAEIYIGQPRYTESITYLNKVLGAGYSLDPNYRDLFLADNNTSPEIIFPIQFDGIRTQSYGGLSYVVNGSIGSGMNPADYGVSGGWNSMRTTSKLVTKFADPTGATDKRAMFFSDGRSLVVNNTDETTDGYAAIKFKNKTSTGANGSNSEFVDIDFPMFRLGDAYLMYAEAVLRGGEGGSTGQALIYVNDLRQRAYGNTNGNIGMNDLTLDFIIDERAREMYWEATRRTDLIRFGLFTTDKYLWDWKGDVLTGRAVDAKYNIYPIPSSDLVSNPELSPTPGYE